MGIYLRKSLRVGPFRFNLSKSGVGVSTGVRGFRVGSGPRGNYVHMGVGGLYYRATLPGSKAGSQSSGSSYEEPKNEYLDQSRAGADAAQNLQKAEVSTIVDASSQELISEIQEKHKKVPFWPFLGILLFVGFVKVNALGLPNWATVTYLVASIALVAGAFYYDQIRKTVVLFYDFDEVMEEAYENVFDSLSKLSAAKRVWFTETSAKVTDKKYHSGADSLVDRAPAAIKVKQPQNIKTNIDIIAIVFGKQILYFFPDKIFIYEGKNVGAISYAEIAIEVGTTQFIESEAVPSDAKVVGSTWQYVNKSGGPDRRFKDNRELPICLYENLSFLSGTGLHKKLILSKIGQGEEASRAIARLSKRVNPA